MEKEVKRNPFFVQLIEKQINNTETVKGGEESAVTDYAKDRVVCMKYPSDADEISYTCSIDRDSSI